MKFLYSNLGLRKYIRDDRNKKIKFLSSFKFDKKEEYSLIEINNIENLLDKNQNTSNKNKGKLYKEENNIIKKQIGRKVEEIVYYYLYKNYNDLNINKKTILKKYEEDDTVGYDISYKTNNNEKYYIEVKGSKQKLNDVVSFYLSNNEYEFMNNHQENYFIFFLDDCFNNKIIKKIKPSEIIDLKPISYKVKFKYK